MIVNLIKKSQMFSLNLPEKVKGQYWLSDIDKKGNSRQVVGFEATDGQWVFKSNHLIDILDASAQRIPQAFLVEMSFFNLRYHEAAGEENEIAILFSEGSDESRKRYIKYVLPESGREVSFRIGRDEDNNFCYGNRFVSGQHARLTYRGNGDWEITDLESTNGTYVNGHRITSCALKAGDSIYVMGLKLVIGYNFLAVNNPENQLKIHSKSLVEYRPQSIPDTSSNLPDITEQDFFFRPPRFYRTVQHTQFAIDPPPQQQKLDTVPMALMLGPSLTMGMTSVSTGILSVSNVLSNGGEIMQALPTMMMSVSMLLGTVLWPILTKKHEKKQKTKLEWQRQQKYLAYLDGVRDELRAMCKVQGDILKENLVSPSECASRVSKRSQKLWERVIGQEDFLRLRLGIGNLTPDAEVKHPEKRFTLEDDNLWDAMLTLGEEPLRLEGVPVSVSLVENTVVGLYGEAEETESLLKAMILQMAALHSYDELKLVVITKETAEGEWNFLRFLPHLWNDDKTVRLFAANADEIKELSAYLERNVLVREDVENKNGDIVSPYYVVIATDKTLMEKCQSVQKMLKYKNNAGFSLLILADELKELPKETKLVVCAGKESAKVFDRNDTTGKATAFRVDDLSGISMRWITEKLAAIRLDVSSHQFNLPNMITFLEMFHVGKIEHLNSLTRWKENNPTQTLQTPVGVDAAGNPFFLDLHEKFHGPHGLVAGMTGSGKSEFIITYILSLAVNYHPDEVAFILIDYKGGGLTGAFEDDTKGIRLPHLAGTITNLDGAAVKRSLISIQSELRRRQAIFNEARKISNEGTMDIYKYQQLYRNRIVKEPVPHLFIISDEFAELKTQQPEFMEQLISAARIGRSLGVHLILATQKPNGVVDDQIWSNSKFRVCLKVQEKADSQEMIKCPDAAELSQTGRFYLQVGFNELFALGQSAWCGAEYIPSDTPEKKTDTDIQVVDHLGRVLLNQKKEKKKAETGARLKQVVEIVRYLSELAAEEKISVRPLWQPPIPAFIYVDELEEKYGVTSEGTLLQPIVGEYDDPFHQKQGVLTIPLSEEGNCLIYGSAGNGKTTFLTTMCYSLIRNHTAEEIHLYLLDFGSETLKVFAEAPQVGDAVIGAEEEKIVNLFRFLLQQLESRRGLFSEYGGDYSGYCKNSGKILPNLVVVINNYAGFAEQYEELQDTLTLLSRDGMKYGIYFVIAASSVSAIRYKIAQNFKTVLTMQLNDAADYSVAVGKTEGLIPSKFKGRGLVPLEQVYEFQTAYCKNVPDSMDYLRQYCRNLAKQTQKHAQSIPVLPERVAASLFEDMEVSLKEIPVGVAKDTLKPACISLQDKMIFPVAAQEIYQITPFIEEFLSVIKGTVKTVLVDLEQLVRTPVSENIRTVTEEQELFVQQLFADMVQRNNVYKEAKMDRHVLDDYEEMQIVIVGIKRLFDTLSEDGKDKLNLLLERGEVFYKLRFVMADTVSGFNQLSGNTWYRRYMTGADGLWLGDGIADQYIIKPSKVTGELYEEIGDGFGYLVSRGRVVRIKQLTAE